MEFLDQNHDFSYFFWAFLSGSLEKAKPRAFNTGFLKRLYMLLDYLMSCKDTDTIVETPRSCIVTP